jgi:trans-aconitate methyltransferase
MPTSLDIYDNDFFDFIKKTQPANLLDVGPGWGRMGLAIKQHLPLCTVDAVEIDSSYITQFNLSSIYNTIHIGDIKTFCNSKSSMRYDVVLFNDILEHLFRSDAMDVLDFMLYRSKYIVVQWPNDLLQDAWEGHESEVHKSNFTLKDFLNHNFDVLKYKKKYYHDHGFIMNFCILKGYKHKTDIAL